MESLSQLETLVPNLSIDPTSEIYETLIRIYLRAYLGLVWQVYVEKAGGLDSLKSGLDS